jgi:hypothetical protein
MEGKKSFVLYTDWHSIFEDLTDEEAGKMIKHIFSYVNDKDPKLDDRMLSLIFKPMQMQLKRDLSKWDSIRQKRSEAGKMGGRPKNQTKAKKANALFEKQTKAKKAVNVNVNVNDINNNRSFVVDANNDLIQYRTYLFDIIKQKKISRDVLLKNSMIDLSKRNELWEAFILNAISETPQIEDEKHAWNCFKKFVKDNARHYQVKESIFNQNYE